MSYHGDKSALEGLLVLTSAQCAAAQCSRVLMIAHDCLLALKSAHDNFLRLMSVHGTMLMNVDGYS